jgi:hypothetical protein
MESPTSKRSARVLVLAQLKAATVSSFLHGMRDRVAQGQDGTPFEAEHVGVVGSE